MVYDFEMCVFGEAWWANRYQPGTNDTHVRSKSFSDMANMICNMYFTFISYPCAYGYNKNICLDHCLTIDSALSTLTVGYSLQLHVLLWAAFIGCPVASNSAIHLCFKVYGALGVFEGAILRGRFQGSTDFSSYPGPQSNWKNEQETLGLCIPLASFVETTPRVNMWNAGFGL